MISIKDYNLETIRDFSDEQFMIHKQLMTDILLENDFGTSGVDTIIKNYIAILDRVLDEHQKTGTDLFRLTKEEVLLYDLNVEIARLCYKHSYETTPNNDWETAF